jgi:hypothetical protein
MATTYKAAFDRFLHHPTELTPADIAALATRDRWLAEAAVKAWRLAVDWRDYRRKHPAPLPVVKLGRSR